MDIGLARVSTRDQNPQLQLDALNAAGCWPIVEEKVSGVSDKRPVRDAALAQLKRGDTLTVWKLDRLGRSVSELLDIVTDLERRGIRFRCLTQTIDTSSPAGRMFLTLLAAFAEFEREIMRERVIAGLQAARERGKFSGTPPYGLDANGDEIPEEAERLREAARRLLDGEPLSRIVGDWHNQGIRPRHGARWRETALRRMMVNPRSIPIIGEDAHRRLVRLFNNASNRRQKLGPPAEHMLSGILHCGRDDCGQPMYWQSFQDPRGGKRRLNYVCKKRLGGRFNGCGRTVVSAPRADAWAEEAFIAAVVAPEFTDALNRRRAELLAGEVTVVQVEEWRAELDDLEIIMPTRFGTEVHRQRHDELQRLVRQATAGLVERPDLQALRDLPKSETQLRDAWDGWSIAERRIWLKRVFEYVAVKPAPPGTHHRGSDVGARMDPIWRI
jgi:DNA invertase Pin-like site-specific DNA recombinase